MSVQKIAQKVAPNTIATPIKKAGKTTAALLTASALILGPMGCKTTSDSFTSSKDAAKTTETNGFIDKKTGNYAGGAGLIGLSAVAAVFGGPAGWAAAAIGVPTGVYVMAKEAFTNN